MSFDFIRKLPTPAEIKEQYPVPADIAAMKEAKERKNLETLDLAKFKEFIASL